VSTERTERCEFSRAVRALVHIVRMRMTRALQVLAELLGLIELVTAHGTLVPLAVPHALRRPALRHVVLAVLTYDEAV
jgi:hypothetical protein